MELTGNELGAFVGAGSTFRKCPTPGKKKSAGETVVPVLIPLHPAMNNGINGNNTSIASR